MFLKLFWGLQYDALVLWEFLTPVACTRVFCQLKNGVKIKTAIEVFMCVCSKIMKYLKFKFGIQICTHAIENFGKAFDLSEIGLALEAFDINPKRACEIAFGKSALGKTGINFVRHVAPNLDSTEEIVKIERRILELVNAGKSAASIAIARRFGAFANGVGASVGAEFGGFGSVTGVVLLAL